MGPPHHGSRRPRTSREKPHTRMTRLRRDRPARSGSSAAELRVRRCARNSASRWSAPEGLGLGLLGERGPHRPRRTVFFDTLEVTRARPPRRRRGGSRDSRPACRYDDALAAAADASSAWEAASSWGVHPRDAASRSRPGSRAAGTGVNSARYLGPIPPPPAAPPPTRAASASREGGAARTARRERRRPDGARPAVATVGGPCRCDRGE